MFTSKFLVLSIALCMAVAGIKAQTTTAVPVNAVWKRPVILPEPFHVEGITGPRSFLLSDNWKIHTSPPPQFWQGTDTASWKDIVVPAQAGMFGIHTRPGAEYAYKTTFRVPLAYKGTRVVLKFEGVTGDAKAYVNGKLAGQHFGGFNLWTCDITDYVQPGGEARLVIGITEPEDAKASSRFDAGGIIRKVKVMAIPRNHLYRFNLETDFDEQYRDAVMKIWVGASLPVTGKSELRFQLADPAGRKVALPLTKVSLAEASWEGIIKCTVSQPVKWDAEHPELYTLTVDVVTDNKVQATYTKKIGFRKVVLQGKDMLVNGKPVKLRGVGRFDSDPVFGRYLSDEKCREEVRMLKEANINFVRPACYLPPEAYLDACDEMGLYVQAENSVTFTRGAQHDTGMAPVFLSQMADMIETVRSRPSVIIYELANETYYGVNIGLTYQYAKAEDPTRPVIFSWSHSVPPGVTVPYDIFSYHYQDWNSDLGAPGVAVFNSRQVRPFPENMPVLHDEFAHGSSYYQPSLARDPGMRDFWGHSIRRFWENMFLTDNCLGGAIWAVIDDNGTGAWAYEWGAIDLWRRKRPEYWHLKKAYSPIRINEQPGGLFKTDGKILLPISNWYDHTNFNELTVQWKMGNKSGTLRLPSVAPHQSGVLVLPAVNTNVQDTLQLKFTDRYGQAIDQFALPLVSTVPARSAVAGKRPGISYEGGSLVITGDKFRILFDTLTGFVHSGVYNGKSLIKGGPYLNLVGVALSNWKLKQLTAMPGDSNVVAVTISGSYDAVDVTFDVTIDGTGLLITDYTIDRFDAAIPMPHKKPWDNQDAGGLEEVGVTYVLDAGIDMLKWKRKGIWSVYPADHIGRNEGTAARYTTFATQQFGKNPGRPWASDEKDFSVFGQYDIGGRGTNDFRSNKEDIITAAAASEKHRVQATVEPVGPTAVRLEVMPDTALYIDNNNPRIVFGGSWKQAADSLTYIGASEMRSSAEGDFVEFTFKGTGIAWLGSAGITNGAADVFIDGKQEAAALRSFNRRGTGAAGKLLYSMDGLTNQQHTIKIVTRKGVSRNAAAQVAAASIAVDAFQVWEKAPEGDVKLHINNLWNHAKMGLGNYMKEPVIIGMGYHNTVRFRMQDLQ